MVGYPPRYVLDSYALLAYLYGEASSSAVRGLLRRADSGEVAIFMSVANYGEALYRTERRWGEPLTRNIATLVQGLPLELVAADREAASGAAHAKANHRMSYADAFAVALALSLDATILTGDPEFHAVEKEVRIEWLA